MIERITWPTPSGDRDLPSPFLHGERERPLRITIHEAALAELSTMERAALDAVRQLTHRPGIEVLTMSAAQAVTVSPMDEGRIPVVGDFKDGQGVLFYGDLPPRYDPSRLLDQREERTGRLQFGWATAPRLCAQLAAQIDGRSDLSDPEVQGRLDDFIAARAHRACNQDILVTMSPWLLARRRERWVSEANPRSPSEAAQIVGLFLRARGDYTYWTDGHGVTLTLNRNSFYWLLAHSRLPHMWRYHEACAAASEMRRDGTLGLGQSVYDRCVRALEARDAIGEQFYVPETEESFDRQGYHFDYLLLLLSGALDAQARVAQRAYGVNVSERNVSFRSSGFLQALGQAGAQELHALVSSQPALDAMALISRLRNAIHGAGLPTLTILQGAGAWTSPRRAPRTSFIGVPREEGAAVDEAARRLGGLDRWGLAWQDDRLVFEAYTYATSLVEETLRLVDAVAAATHVEGLFPPGTPIPLLAEHPAEDMIQNDMLQRIAALG